MSEKRNGQEVSDADALHARRGVQGAGERAERRGTCRPQCGACCSFVTLAIHPAYAQADTKSWLALHGIRVTERDGGVWAFLPIPCRELQPDMSCGIFGKPERPQLCDEWPFNQQEIITLREVTGVECSYSFTERE